MAKNQYPLMLFEAATELKTIYRVGSSHNLATGFAYRVGESLKTKNETAIKTDEFWKKYDESTPKTGNVKATNAWGNLFSLLLDPEVDPAPSLQLFLLKHVLVSIGTGYGDYILAVGRVEKTGPDITASEKIAAWESYTGALDKFCKLHEEIVGEGSINITRFYPKGVLSVKPTPYEELKHEYEVGVKERTIRQQLEDWKTFAEGQLLDLESEKNQTGRIKKPQSQFVLGFIHQLARGIWSSKNRERTLELLNEKLTESTLSYFLNHFTDEQYSERSIRDWKARAIAKVEESIKAEMVKHQRVSR